MVYESGLILLMLGSFIFMYFFLDYFKLRFIEFLNTKKDFNNKKRTIMTKLVEEMDLLFIIHMFISILFFTNLFLQTTSEAQNTILSGWFSFIILEFTPFILLTIINFVLRFIEVIRDTDDD